MTQQISVPLEAVIEKVAGQRNNAHDALARAEVFIEDLMAQNEQLREENEKLRGDAVTTLAAGTAAAGNAAPGPYA